MNTVEYCLRQLRAGNKAPDEFNHRLRGSKRAIWLGTLWGWRIGVITLLIFIACKIFG